MKIKRVVVLIIMIFTLLVLFTSCENSIGNHTSNNQEPYIMAQKAGFTGTYEKWKTLITGIDESKISSVTSENDELIITLATGETINLGNVHDTVVPIYQGMSVTNDIDHDKKETKRNRDAKFKSKRIKDAISDFIEVITTEKVEFYTTKGEKFNIAVHLYNPSSFEILSFTLNNRKYQTFEFKEGSTSSELIIEVEAEKTPGIKEYTIDSIKYIDKTEIKDVKMEGNKTIKVGVKYDVVPTASIISEDLTLSSFEQVVEITDDNNLITQNNGLYFFLYDGNNVVYNAQLKLGINTIQYDNILMGTKYEYIIVAIYDDCSGDGNQAVELAYGELDALNGFEISQLEGYRDSIFIKLSQNALNAKIGEINVYDDTNLVKTTKGSTNTIFDNLISNHNYVVEVVYEFESNGVTRFVSFKQNVKTLECKIPSFNINSLQSDKKKITYDVTLIDTDNVVISKSYNLIKNGQVIQTKQENQSTFTNLLSNNNYDFEILYIYNLKDGEGNKEIRSQVTLKTTSLSIPKIDITTNTSVNQITIKELITDVDNTITSIDPVILDDKNIEITKIDDKEYLLNNAKSNHTYTIKLVYKYNLNDGLGEIEATENFEVTTKKQAPTIKFMPYNIRQESIEFDLFILDNNATGRVNLITLYEGLTFIKRIGTNANKVEDLKPDTNYTMKINYIYDFDDGYGSREINEEYNFTTLKKEPKYNLSLSEINYTSIEFTHEIDDVDGVLKFKKARILLNSNVVEEKTSINDTVFEKLLADNTYKIIVLFERDLNNGLEEVSYSYYVTTKKYPRPNVEITLNSSKSNIMYNYRIEDEYNIAKFVGASILYNGERLNKTDTNQIFSNLLSNTQYTVRITLLVAYGDGGSPKYEYYEQEVKTKSLDDIDLIINLTSNKKRIDFTYNLADLDSIATIIEIRLYLGYELKQTITDLSTNYFDRLYSNTNYRVVFLVKKDFRDNHNPVICEYTASTWTKSLTTPELEANLSVTTNSIFYDLNIDDLDNILKIDFIELYDVKQNKLIGTYGLTDDNVLSGLSPATQYLVLFYYSYDLNEGKGNITKAYSASCNTLLSEVKISSINVLNEGSPKVNEDITLKINLTSDIQVKVLYVVLNGKMINCIERNDFKSIVVIIPAQKVSGEMEIVVSKFGYQINEIDYEQKLYGNNTKKIQIMSDFTVLDISLVDGGFLDRREDQNGYVLKVDNPSGYELLEVYINYYESDIGYAHYPIRIDDTHWFIHAFEIVYSRYYYITSIKYIDENNNEAIKNCQTKIYVNYALNIDPETKPIEKYQVSTPEEFMNMKECAIYELTNDIDMSGYKWEPYIFSGHFDGKGHKVSNISYAHEDKWKQKYEDILYFQATSLMRFSMECTFKNVYFENIYFSIDSTAWNRSNQIFSVFAAYPRGDIEEGAFQNVLISGTVKTKNNGVDELHHVKIPSPSTYIVGDLTVNGVSYSGSNLITKEESETTEFREETLNWIFTKKDTYVNDNFKYQVIDNSYICILEYIGTSKTVTIPNTINGLPVICIVDCAFEDNTLIEKIEIPDTVLSVGIQALKGCYNLQSIKMENVDAREKFTYLFGFEEYYSSYAKDYDAITAYIPYSLRKLELGSISHKMILENLFSYYISVEVIILEDDITELGHYIFTGCSALKEIKLPNSLEKMGSSVFSYSGLESITFPDSLTIIPQGAFFRCERLKTINFSPYIKEISSTGFSSCYSLQQVVIPDNVEYIGSNAFEFCWNLKNVILSNSIQIISKSTFNSCNNLTNIYIPDSVKRIEKDAFANCNRLETVTGMFGATYIGFEAFANCPIQSIYIPSNVTSIENLAFDSAILVECEVSEKPQFWADDWCNSEIRWGVKRKA